MRLYSFVIFLFIAHTTLLASETLKDSQQKVIIGAQQRNTPYSFVNYNGEIDGFSIDLIEVIFQRMGRPYEVRMIPFGDHFNLLDSNKIDMAAAMIFSKKRAEKYTFSTGYQKYTHDIVWRTGDNFQNLADLQDKKIIVKRQGLIHHLLIEKGLAKEEDLILVPDMQIGLQMLSQGKGDAALLGNASAKDIITREEITNLKVAKADLPDYEICFASKDRFLMRDINNIFNSLLADGTYDKIYYQWFGNQPTNPISKYVYWALIILLVALVAFSLHFFVLRSKIRRAVEKVKRTDDRNLELGKSLSTLFKDADFDVYLQDDENKKLYVLDDGEYKLIEESTQYFEDLIHPDDLALHKKNYAEIISGSKDTVVSSFRMFNPELQKYEYFEHVISPIQHNEKGVVTKFIFTKRNCTEVNETIANQSELINNLHLALRSGKLLRWSYDIKEMVSKIVDENDIEYEFIGKDNINQVAPEDRERFTNYLYDLAKDKDAEKSIEARIKHPDGSHYVSYEVTAMAYFEDEVPTAIYGVWKDVTESSTDKKQIIELQKRIAMALEAGDMTTWIYDCKKQTFSVLQGMSISLEGKMSKEYYNSNIHPDDLETTWAAINAVACGILEKTSVQFRFHTPKGWQWYLSSFMGVCDDGKITQLTGIRRNITLELEAKKQLEDLNLQLQEENKRAIDSEARLKKILGKLPLPIMMKDYYSLSYSYLNDEAIKTYNLSLGATASDLLTKENAIEMERVDKLLIESGEEYIGNEVLHYKDGRVLETFVKKIPINIDGMMQILAVRLNLTEQNIAKRESKILSASLPSLKAYTWYMNANDGVVHYGSHEMKFARDLTELNSLELFMGCIHPEDREKFAVLGYDYLQMESGEATIAFRIDLLEVGVYEWWEAHCVLETTYENEVPHKVLYGITLNIENRKQDELKLEALNKQNTLILNNISSGILYIDRDFTVQWSNMSHIFGSLNGNEFKIGDKCYAGYGLNSPCEGCQAMDAISTNRTCKFVSEVENSDQILEVIHIPISNNGVAQGLLMKVDDISEQTRMVSNLREINSELAIAKEKAEESERLKMAFLANMSHEIRTPLNAIVGFSGLLQDVEDDEEREEYIKIINTNNELLLRLIGDILDLSKLESGTIEIKPETFDIIESFETGFIHFSERCPKNITLKRECNLSKCIVTIDRARVTQVLSNFASNAMKYSPDGEIVVGIDYVNNGIKVFVKDTGIGIPEDKKHLIFQRFEKIDSFAQGTGLGLAICKAITERLDGEIGFDSTYGEGSTFWAWFPCKAEFIE